MSDLSFISFPLPSYKIDIDWPNKRSFHSQSFLFKLNSYVQMTSDVIYQEIFWALEFSSFMFLYINIHRSKYDYVLWGKYDDLYLIWMYKMMDESVRWHSFLLVLVRYGTVTCALDIWSWYAELCYYSIYIMFHTRATLRLNR